MEWLRRLCGFICIIQHQEKLAITNRSHQRQRSSSTQFVRNCILGRITVLYTTYVDAAYRPSGVVCRSVCLSVRVVNPAKTAEPIEIPFGLWTRLGPKNHSCTWVTFLKPNPTQKLCTQSNPTHGSYYLNQPNPSSTLVSLKNKNSSGDEIANANF